MSPGFIYELRMLLVAALVWLTMAVAPKKAGGLRLIRAFREHYEEEVSKHGS